ncbi:MAG: hypothetical protein SPE06_07100 [[Actinobacillus] rossii]|uniref:Uncharacterized protein n=1 Tax=[Actinobacillus] rossii TaxID=123820 RepID=A0A380TZR7_9PAST|nr:hypothetical protein [[Actinobacillus] rossii]MDY4506149.1 hypothetical protein [[Actinobacillus] rossii]SUT93521.1 Uncharacterised protein [[Actinobacillus] rossii]
MIYEELEDGELIIIDRKKIDTAYIEKCGQNLNEFENWLFSGVINPVDVQDALNRFYEELPF